MLELIYRTIKGKDKLTDAEDDDEPLASGTKLVVKIKRNQFKVK